MKLIIAASFLLSVMAEARTETRCGWYANPTPANHWLTDADATWYIGVQGGHQAEGNWEFDGFSEDRWVYNYPGTQLSYGYGCACLKGDFETSSKNVLTIEAGWFQDLDLCEDDPNLPAQ